MKVLWVQINNFIDTLKEPIIFLDTIPLSFCYSKPIYSEFNNLVFEPSLDLLCHSLVMLLTASLTIPENQQLMDIPIEPQWVVTL